MSIDSFGNLSLDEIQERLDNIDNDRVELEKALELRRQQSRKELADEIKDMILSQGYELSEIIELVGTRKRGVGRGRGSRAYIRYVDPENVDNVYIRGVLPKWMKDQMGAKGLDPKNKDDRITFKQQHLTRLED